MFLLFKNSFTQSGSIDPFKSAEESGLFKGICEYLPDTGDSIDLAIIAIRDIQITLLVLAKT